VGTAPLKNPQLPQLLKGQSLKKVSLDDPIDMVVLWVDMSDPVWAAKYTKHTGKKTAEWWRYSNNGELELCVASVMKHMPWIRTLYVITDNQTPDFISKYPKAKVIDHSEILGEGCAKPTFNSNVIETYMHRIPGLSDVFLWGSDDCMVGQPSKRSDWFQDGVPVVTLTHRTIFPPPTNTLSIYIWNTLTLASRFSGSLAVVDENKALCLTHQIGLLRKSSCEKVWELFPEVLGRLVRVRTRQKPHAQIQTHLLASLIGIYTGDFKLNLQTKHYSNRTLDSIKSADKARLDRFYSGLLTNTPPFYCINSVRAEFLEEFKTFKAEMLSRLEGDNV
jgi:hypothetical protein